MSLTYDVEIRYLESGNIGEKIGKVKNKLGEMGESLSKSIDAGIGSAIDKVGELGMALGGIGIMAGVAFGGIVGHIAKVNSELEDTRIALAATFAARGASSSFLSGLGDADTQIIKMRKDVSALPGTFDELANIMQSMAPSALNVMSPDKMREMAARTMAVASIDRIPMNVAAREMAALIEGKAGSQNILGRKFLGLTGDKAKAFNHLSMEKRVEVINTEMNKKAYTDAIEAQRHSFHGLYSTLKMNAKTFAQTAGTELFEKMKGSLETVNDWFNHNQGTVGVWAGKIGHALASAWEFGANAFERWWGPITSFVGQLMEEIRSIGHALAPLFAGIGDSLRTALGNGEAIKTLERVAGAYAMMKIGAPLMGGMASGIGRMGGAMIPSMIEGVGSLGVAGGLLGAGAAAVALTALAAAAGEASAAMNVYSSHHQEAINSATQLETAFGSLMGTLNVSIIPAFEGLGVALTSMAADVVRGVNDILNPRESIRGALNKNMPGMAGGMFGDMVDEAIYGKRLKPTEDDRTFKSPYELDTALPQLLAMAKKDDNKDKPPGAPNHSTNIQKVEIVVQTNQDPNRIARLVGDKLAEFSKNPKGAKSVPSFLARR